MDISNYIVGKIKYDEHGQYFFDKENNMIAELRGWGRIQNLFNNQDEAGDFQDEVGRFIADAINEKLNRK